MSCENGRRNRRCEMFSPNELEAMRQTQDDHMMDTCVIYRVKEKVKDKRGTYSFIFEEGQESICGLKMSPVSLSIGENMQTADIDAVLRLPLGTVVNPDDEIVITKRFGEEVPPRRYRVERCPNDGPSGSRAYLKVRTVL